MYARITPYKMKPGSKKAAVKIMQSLKSRIQELPGQHQFINTINDTDGSGYVISLTDIPDVTPEMTDKIRALWASFNDFLEVQPSPATFEVVANWEMADA